MLPSHEVVRCEVKEYDSEDFDMLDQNGSRQSQNREGEKISVEYHWLGEWEQRPSKLMIYKNYQTAIEKQGGESLYAGSAASFKLKKGGDTYWIKINTDGSGNYTYTSIREAAMNQYVDYTADEIGKMMNQDGQVTFYGIYFDSDQAVVKPESSDLILQIATYLKANPTIQVYLVGHTDNTGTAEHNLKLSKDRAAAVALKLTGEQGIPSAQVSAEGVGVLSPVASNLTEEGKAKNRRVVMVLK